MTEAEWLQCSDPERMLEFLRGKVSDRKLRLFVCACCRRIWHLLADGASQQAVEMAEQSADDMAQSDALRQACASAEAAYKERRRVAERTPGLIGDLSAYWAAAATADASRVAWLTSWATESVSQGVVSVVALLAAGTRQAEYQGDISVCDAEMGVQCCLLSDLFGPLPLRPVIIDPAWLTWRDGTIPKLAQSIYDDRAFDQLPILADALEEAGCTSREVLDHCRGPGPHVRGCWVVDLVLGKG
jgi:hypothetical protein